MSPGRGGSSHTPLIQTTAQGNSWKISGPYELQYLDPERLRQKFVPGTEPASRACT